MSFGELQLRKFGWKEGKGLGRHENGISSAIKPKLKFNSSGFGYDVAAEFSFQWWDHVYNKTAKNISVGKKEDGEVIISKKKDFTPATKKKSTKNKSSNCYGYFVKGTVLNNDEVSTAGPDWGSSESSEEETHELLKTLTDEELFRNCRGLTGHKGARHGINMSAKLARLQAQEQEFTNRENHLKNDEATSSLAQLGSTHKRKLNSDLNKESDLPPSSFKQKLKRVEKLSSIQNNFLPTNENTCASKSLKKKKKKKKSHTEAEELPKNEQMDFKMKKKTKRKINEKYEFFDETQNVELADCPNEVIHRKHKKKKSKTF